MKTRLRDFDKGVALGMVLGAAFALFGMYLGF